MNVMLWGPIDSMAYTGLDFYGIDALLTEEELMIRDMVRDWVEEEIIPNIEEACRDGVFPNKWREDFARVTATYSRRCFS